MRKALWIAALLAAALLTGCGQTADSEPPEPEDVPSPPVQEEPAPPQPVFPEELQAALERAGVSAEDIAGRQLIVVCADGNVGQLLRFEADEQLVWTKVGDTVEARVGQNGVSSDKTEGDRKTPQGLFFLGHAFGCEEPPTDIAIGFRRVTPDSYWVDDRDSAYYNQWVEGTAYKDWVSAEHLADYPTQYALAVVVQYNNDPPQPGAGSAIFLHCGERPTMGCIAIAHDRMAEVLSWLRPEETPMILIETRGE